MTVTEERTQGAKCKQDLGARRGPLQSNQALSRAGNARAAQQFMLLCQQREGCSAWHSSKTGSINYRQSWEYKFAHRQLVCANKRTRCLGSPVSCSQQKGYIELS